jgi:hypothetical protein
MKKQSGKKLVEILAVELREWPECKYLTQDEDSKVYGWSGKPEYRERQWLVSCSADVVVWRPVSIDLAADYATAIVTRDQWEAERAKLSKPKANAQGWVRNRGRKNPFDVCTLVDARLRSGEVAVGKFSDNLHWIHTGNHFDVMAYRVNESVDTASPEVTAQVDGPLQWRDRITEIDWEVEALEEERASLIQKLADEGFKLIKRDAVERVEQIEEWQRLAMINGRRVEAVKEHRAKHGSSLRDALIAIDNYREDNGYAGG